MQALRDIDLYGAFPALALDRALSRHELSPPDRGLATEIVYGVTRRRNTLDWALGLVLSRPLEGLDPWTRNALRLGAYQLLYLDAIPAHAAVNEAVELGKRYGHAGIAKLINGVLRGLARRLPDLPYPDPATDPVAHLALRHSHPEWLVRRWLARFGWAETVALLEADNVAPAFTIRANRLRTSREELLAQLGREGVAAEPGRYHPQALNLLEHPAVTEIPAFGRGLFTVQDETSMLATAALDPRPGDTVLDACAGLGGKTTHLAELMGDDGRVIATDIHPYKLEQLRAAAARLGVGIVEARRADARELGGELEGRADAALVDAPCTGLGVLRRRPDARWKKRESMLDEMPELQYEILVSAARCLRPGGVLVYSTCSIEPEENGAVVRRLLSQQPGFSLDPLRPHLPASLEPDLGPGAGELQLLPHRHGVDGFYVARLRRER